MKKTMLALSVFVFSICAAQAQSDAVKPTAGRTSFFAELGGPGILFSANIDTRFKPSHLGLGGRLGVGFVTGWESEYDPQTGNYLGGEDVSVITVPAQVNYIFGKVTSPHTFEVGAGLTYVGRKLDILNFYDDNVSNVYGSFSFMYRRQPIDGGFTWRIGFTPLIAKGYIQPFGAVSVGYSF